MKIKIYESDSPIFLVYDSLPWYKKIYVRYCLWRMWKKARVEI